MLIALVAFLAAATTDAAPGPGQPATPPAAAAARAKTSDEVVCHTEQVTGSMFPHKVCRRKAESDAARADQQRALREVQKPVGLPGH